MTTITSGLLAWAGGRTYDAATRHAAKRCLVDWFGCATGGVDSAAATAARELVAGSGGRASIIGTPATALPQSAALANATAGHALDFDDENVWLFGHPGATIIPAVVALAEAEDLSVGAVLRAVVAGYEIASHLGRIANPGHYLAGWHATSTLGSIAASAACAELLRLTPKQQGSAVTLAAAQAGGLRAVFGSDAKALQVGAAASAAVAAAMLARLLPDAQPEVVSEYLAMVGSTASDLLSLRQSDPTQPYSPAILETSFKWHAACGAAHCVIEAVAKAMRGRGATVEDIVAMHVFVGDLTANTANRLFPASAHEAQFSLPHLAALATVTYPVLPSSLWPMPDHVLYLRDRCEIRVVPEFAGDEHHPARVTLDLRTGETATATVLRARGTVAWPLSDEDLSKKFISLVEPRFGGSQTTAVLEHLWQASDSLPIRSLMKSLQSATTRRFASPESLAGPWSP